ncbi:phosphoglycerate mutase [Psychromonas sp. psych-6C06]|nr:phosphoglycerate mutase [Psychromonas sp. psych-6C06]
MQELPFMDKKKTQRTYFYLARHGQTHWNIAHRIQGQLDSPLTTVGQQQAKDLADACQVHQITKILTSSLGRAVETATICAQQLQLQQTTLKGIEERNFGLWEGKLTGEVQRCTDYDEITSQVTDIAPPNGESAAQLLMRFETALKQQFTLMPCDNYLIITHGDVLRCFMSQFLAQNEITTGYDYKNGHIISMCYDHSREQFIPL